MFGKHAILRTAINGAKTKGLVAGTILSNRDLNGTKVMVSAKSKLIAYHQNIRILNLIRILLKKKTTTGKKDTILMWATNKRLWSEVT